MHGTAVGQVNIVTVKKGSVRENIPPALIGMSKIRLIIFITFYSQFVIPQINLSPDIKNIHLGIDVEWFFSGESCNLAAIDRKSALNVNYFAKEHIMYKN